jgi:hypothetical protein
MAATVTLQDGTQITLASAGRGRGFRVEVSGWAADMLALRATEKDVRAVIRLLADALPEHVRAAVVEAVQDADATPCGARCPCCGKPCSGKHYNQIHGVEPDDHWGGAKV